MSQFLFQSLSGLTLCLNRRQYQLESVVVMVSIPFRADTVFEQQISLRCGVMGSFNPFQG